MRRRSFLARVAAGTVALLGVGKQAAITPPAEDLGGFLVPPDVAKGIWEERQIVGNAVEATWGIDVLGSTCKRGKDGKYHDIPDGAFTSEIPGTRRVFTEDGDELI